MRPSFLIASCLLVSSVWVFYPTAKASNRRPQPQQPKLEYVAGVELVCQSKVDAVVEGFVRTIETLESICDAQNDRARAAGEPACPPASCRTEYRPGDTDPPTLTFDITFTRNLSLSVSGTSASSYISSGASTTSGSISGGISGSSSGFPGGGFPGGGSSNSQGLVIRIGLVTKLGPNPDVLVCTNPMSEKMREAFLAKVFESLDESGPACEP